MRLKWKSSDRIRLPVVNVFVLGCNYLTDGECHIIKKYVSVVLINIK